MGVIVKRPIANGAWGASESPSGYADQYFERAQRMHQAGPIPNTPAHRILLALGFTLAHNAVDTAIVGTRDPEHMKSNIEWVEEKLPISDEAIAALHQRFDEMGQDWVQLS
jgi:aryl-alcohol dehydrogenase-like predicted oxidoreductase